MEASDPELLASRGVLVLVRRQHTDSYELLVVDSDGDDEADPPFIVLEP
jgi:hypothetical protein